MRSLLVIFSLAIFLNSAQIDNSLFENKSNPKFYEDLEKKIEESSKKQEFTQEIINTQKINLKRLRELISKDINIEKFDNSYFINKDIDIDTYFEAILTLAKTQIKIDTQNSLLGDVQNKLIFLKKSIEDIIEQDKQNLLTYQLQYAYYRIQKSNIEQRVKELKKIEDRYEKSLLNLSQKSKVLI